MKLVVNKDVILEGLQKVQSVVGSKTTLPILYNVLIKAEDGKVWLTVTDLELSVRTSVEAKVSRIGSTTLPARRVFSIFRELPGNEIEIDVDEKDVASIRSGTAFFKIIGMAQEEFPPIPEFKGGRSYVVDQALFKKMLACTHFSASSDEARYILNGVLMSFRGEKLTIVATDGRRMALFENEVEFPTEAEGDWVIPSKTVHELLRTLKPEGQVKIQVSGNQVAFEFDTMLIVSKLVDGTFPNFRQVIPGQSEERVAIERETLLSAIKRVALLSSDKTNSVTLTFDKNKLEISAVASDIGEASESVTLKYSGNKVSISFNPEFVMDPLRALETDEVFMEFSDELSPCLMKCDAPFLYVLMPMRVK